MQTPNTVTSNSNSSAGTLLRISLWLAQVFIFVMFLISGYMKVFMAPEALAAMWDTQWPVEYPNLLRFTGVIDAVLGLGILLPALTRIQPKLTLLAALGCVALQILAIAFHVMRGEFGALPVNAILLPVVAFILWGRRKRAPIFPRT